MTTDTELLREKIRQALEVGHRATPDAASVARSALRTWKQILALITPVLGKRGVEVLFDRSLYLTSQSFPWLGSAGEPGASPLEALRSRLEDQEPMIAREAATAMLVTFAELLAALIGSAVTTRMLMPVVGSAVTKGEDLKP